MAKIQIPIYLQGADPDSPAPDPTQTAKPWDGDEKRHYVVQFSRALTAEESAHVKQDLRLRLDRYVPDLTYIEYLDESTVAGLGGHDLVNEFFPLLPMHKIAPDIGDFAFRSDGRKATAGRLLRAILFRDVELDDIESQLRERGADEIRVLDDRPWSGVARAEFLVTDAGAIPRIAELEMVSWIEEIPEVVANAGIPADILDSGTMNHHPILDNGLRGKGQVVAIIDKGRMNFDHCWFKDVKDGANRPIGAADAQQHHHVAVLPYRRVGQEPLHLVAAQRQQPADHRRGEADGDQRLRHPGGAVDEGQDAGDEEHTGGDHRR